MQNLKPVMIVNQGRYKVGQERWVTVCVFWVRYCDKSLEKQKNKKSPLLALSGSLSIPGFNRSDVEMCEIAETRLPNCAIIFYVNNVVVIGL